MFWNNLKKPETPPIPPRINKTQPVKETDRGQVLREVISKVFQGRAKTDILPTMDDVGYPQSGFTGVIPDGILKYFANHSFIGYQACLTLSQHWLIGAACGIPVDDALRKGWQVVGNDGDDVPVEAIAAIKEEDKRIGIDAIANNYGKFGRIFGYRVAIFLVKGFEPEDYENPFNPDGITEGSYEGILTPDPYFCVPIIEHNNPNELGFYEPEYWKVGGVKYHKSHCCVWRHEEVGQLLKPVYLYGGVSLPQQIFERVYQADLAANEANKLLMTKRLWVQNGSIEAMIADQWEAENRIKFIQQMRDNFGVLLVDTDDKLEQMDTPLTEVTSVIAQKFEHVAAIARMPANKLMQTPLQGFGSNGEAEEAIYHETLESLQRKCFKPLIEKHTLYAMRSRGMNFKFEVMFNPLDSLKETEQATVNQTKAMTDQALIAAGAIDAMEVRQRVINDPTSGYNGLDGELPQQPDYENDNEESDNEPGIVEAQNVEQEAK